MRGTINLAMEQAVMIVQGLAVGNGLLCVDHIL